MKNFEDSICPEIPELQRLAIYLVPDRHCADEVVQKTLIRAHQQWHSYREEDAVGPWLRTILRFLVKSELKELQRSGKRKQRYRDEWLREIADEGLPEDHGPIVLLDRCREELAPQSAKLIRLKYDDHLSCCDIAKSFDRSISWVTTTLSRVRQALKICLEKSMKEIKHV
jgi:RNA polymerase sigma factor (sigma-70 family)